MDAIHSAPHLAEQRVRGIAPSFDSAQAYPSPLSLLSGILRLTDVVALQRACGNQAVLGLIARGGIAPLQRYYRRESAQSIVWQDGEPPHHLKQTKTIYNDGKHGDGFVYEEHWSRNPRKWAAATSMADDLLQPAEERAERSAMISKLQSKLKDGQNLRILFLSDVPASKATKATDLSLTALYRGETQGKNVELKGGTFEPKEHKNAQAGSPIEEDPDMVVLDNSAAFPEKLGSFDLILMRRGICYCEDLGKTCGGIALNDKGDVAFLQQVINALAKQGGTAFLQGYSSISAKHGLDKWREAINNLPPGQPNVRVTLVKWTPPGLSREQFNGIKLKVVPLAKTEAAVSSIESIPTGGKE